MNKYYSYKGAANRLLSGFGVSMAYKEEEHILIFSEGVLIWEDSGGIMNCACGCRDGEQVWRVNE